MGTKRNLDYIYKDGTQEIVIELDYQSVKTQVIEQYIRCRKSQGITQEELARRTGVSRPNISRFESGTYNPSLEMMVKIAAALGMKLQINLEQG